MPKSKGKRVVNDGEHIETVHFVSRATVTATGVIGTFALVPVGGFLDSAKLAAMADLFQYWRWKSLSVEVGPTSFGSGSPSTQGVEGAWGIAQGDLTSPPSSFLEVLDLPISHFKWLGETMPRRKKVPIRFLRGMVPWYKTVIGSFDQQLEIPATLYTFGTTDVMHYLLLEGSIEFKSFIGTANNPFKHLGVARRQEPADAKEDSASAVIVRSGDESEKDSHGSVLADAVIKSKLLGYLSAMSTPGPRKSA
jgi:hypothetical protein